MAQYGIVLKFRIINGSSNYEHYLAFTFLYTLFNINTLERFWILSFILLFINNKH